MCYLIYRKVNFIQKISWFSLNSWRIFFSGYRILGWQHISFNTWKMYYIQLAPIVSDEKLADIWIVFPLWIKYHYLFTSSLFSRFFFLSLVIKRLIVIYLDLYFFEFVLLGISLAFWTYMFLSFGKFEKFLPIFFSEWFFSSLFSI